MVFAIDESRVETFTVTENGQLTGHWFISPRRSIDFLALAAGSGAAFFCGTS
jgi:hypothetical protein